MNDITESNGTRYMVTGASGFIAMHLIELLLSRGHRVRGTLRRMDRALAVTQALAQRTEIGDRLELFLADLDHDAGWSEAAAGVSGVFHVASPVPKHRSATNASLGQLIGAHGACSVPRNQQGLGASWSRLR